MKTFTVEHEYAVPPGQFVELLADADFLAAKQQRFGGAGKAVVERADGRLTLRVPRQIPLDAVPAPARPLLPSGGRITHVESWQTAGEPLRCAWHAEVGPGPAKIGGTASLASTASGCRYAVEGRADVRVPILGGRLEDMVTDYLSQLLGTEMSFAADWLAARG